MTAIAREPATRVRDRAIEVDPKPSLEQWNSTPHSGHTRVAAGTAIAIPIAALLTRLAVVDLRRLGEQAEKTVMILANDTAAATHSSF
jgi:hypothetical protein